MARRILLAVGGTIALLLGLTGGASAAVAYGLFQGGETVSLPAGRITGSPEATAIVIDLEHLSAGLPVVAGERRVFAVFRSVDGSPLFAGLGARPDVDAYLIGTPTTVAERDGDRWRSVDVPGSAVPGPPELAPVWLRSATGAEAAVSTDGVLPATIAILHPQPKAPLDVLVDVRTTIPGIQRVIIGLGIVALALIVVGITLLVVASRRVKPSDQQSSPTVSTRTK